MLRIKKDVDLKKLKELGFDYHDEYGQFVYNTTEYEGMTTTIINIWNRKIYVKGSNPKDPMPETIQDLVLLGYTEKVKNKNDD